MTSRQQEYSQPAASREPGAQTAGPVPQGSGRGDSVGMGVVEVVEGEGGRVQWILLKLWGDACECRFLA
jgi:hypothetical protein